MSEPVPVLSLWRGPIQAFAAPGCIKISQSVLDAEIDYVCQAHKVTRKELMSPERRRQVSHARFELYWRLRSHTWPLGGNKYSLPEIGRALNRDHTSVLHGLRRWEAILQQRDNSGY